MKKSLKILLPVICLIAFSVSLNSCTSPEIAQENELYDSQRSSGEHCLSSECLNGNGGPT